MDSASLGLYHLKETTRSLLKWIRTQRMGCLHFQATLVPPSLLLIPTFHLPTGLLPTLLPAILTLMDTVQIHRTDFSSCIRPLIPMTIIIVVHVCTTEYLCVA